MASSANAADANLDSSIWTKTPYAEIRGGVQAIFP